MSSSGAPAASRRAHLGQDALASVVVFLVALPLCLGIAIASGVPPALGLITGIVGGLVVAPIAGQPLQVSGPAAGLAVMVWQLVEQYGVPALGLAVLMAGVVQFAAGAFGLGRWFRAVAPAVVQGMLAGIGVLIFASQFHLMIDDSPRGDGVSNLLSIPEAIGKGVVAVEGTVHHFAAGVGVLTILSIVLWNRFRPKQLKVLPGPLVGVTVASVAVAVMGLPIARVDVPTDLIGSLQPFAFEAGPLLMVPAFWGSAFALAIIASAETLLSATAVDRMHDGQRTKYDQELRAQGIGNMVCGILGALPLTGVIVRSSANVEAGAKTSSSAILHGIWILILVAVFPTFLALIPVASLAAILVYTGWKLMGFPAARRLAAKGRAEFFTWAATVITIVATDLLTGVLTGFAIALARLLFTFARLGVQVRQSGTRYDVELHGAATFMSLPKLAEALESIPDDSEVHVHLDAVSYFDNACLELIEDWHQRHPGTVFLERERLKERSDPEFGFSTSGAAGAAAAVKRAS